MDTAGLSRAQKATAESQSLQNHSSSSSGNVGGDRRDDSNGMPGTDSDSPSQRKRSAGNKGEFGSEAVEGAQEGTGNNDAAVIAQEDASALGSIAAAAAAAATAEAEGEGVLPGGGQAEVEAEDGVREALEPSGTRLDMLPMGAVAHLSRRDRLGIIRKTVPKERRMLVLQRLFHLAQGEWWVGDAIEAG